jgi:iron complex outermembrane receptor protein
MNNTSLEPIACRNRIVAVAVSLATALSMQSHVTTAAAADDEGQSLQEIVVTGTSIKGLDAESALPVQVLSRDDLERTGATTVEQLFRQISAASSSRVTVAATATGVLTGAISTISLRGLGSGRTLVLINGKRSAVYGGGSTDTAGNSVDISAIPISEVERVEILKDGASAIYGSDAIAGVVNFILRTDFRGLEVSSSVGAPTHQGGGTETTASVFGGIGNLHSDRYNLSAGFNYDHQLPILGQSRASFANRYSPQYGNDVTSSFAFPANVALTGGKGTKSPGAGNCGPESLNDVNFPTQCRFDNTPFDSLVPEITKLGGTLHGGFALNDTNQLYADASFSDVRTTTQVQPVPLSYQNPLLPGNPYIAYLANLLATKYPTYVNAAVKPGTGAFLLGPGSPYYPTAFATANGVNGQPLNLIYRDFANGPRLTEDIADTFRAVGGVKGKIIGWDYDLSVLYSQVKVHEDLESGYPLYSKLMPLLDAGQINPFGPTSDPAALAAAKATEFTGQDFQSKTSITSVGGTASRELLTLPGGPFSGAIGAEYRRETFNYSPAPAVQGGDIAGQGGNQLPEAKGRNVESAYVEFNAPVIKGLDVDAAVRYDNYQRVGSTVNPKGSIKFQPIEQIVLRGSAGTGFRAPSLTDLYAAQVSSVTANGTRDPILCPVFSANNPACSFQFTILTGGNPNLQPEKSTTYTLGAVLQPVSNLTLEADYFWIFLRNTIMVGGLNYATILQNAATATQFAGFITRDAAGNIISINQTNANLFKSALSGLDLDLKYHFDIADAGRITVLGNGTYFYKYDTQNPDGSYTPQLDKGLTSIGGVLSRWRYNATLMYDIANLWNLSVTQNYQKKFHDVPGNIKPIPHEVSPYDTFDAQVTFLGLKQFQFTVGAINVFDRNPPYANYASSANNFIGGYDLSYGDPRGRFVYGRVTFTWK